MATGEAHERQPHEHGAHEHSVHTHDGHAHAAHQPDDGGFHPLQRRLERRGFLARAALAGSAMTVAPLRYLLKPGTAYAAICGCAGGRECDCGSTCCDGYTEFCCTLTGVNGCPPGSMVAGWWKADGSGLCAGPGGSDSPRYYLDCNATAAGPCGASGVTGATNDCACDCAGGDCGLRKSCCTAFRYGQCNQAVPCLGPIVCRIVTCTAAVDPRAELHHGPGHRRLHPLPRRALPAHVAHARLQHRRRHPVGQPARGVQGRLLVPGLRPGRQR